ncbi:MAG: isoprenylcysteine carboxylmethyltransferase family protein [Candidatus Lokiarchaeota archaeon]|nr:isoprenylcysteine carboxylmethyltransferase family protein [Candidatus Lokiarchaeota archaeon]
MSILWILRLIAIGLLYVIVLVFAYFLKNRNKYDSLLENKSANLFMVLLYQFLCYFLAILPSDPAVFLKPRIFKSILVIIWFFSLGLIFIIFGIVLMIITIKKRKAIGGQDTEGMLLTDGFYSFCRHPIYLGTSLIALGLAIGFMNFDGLLVIPAIIAVNLIEGKIEELYDLRQRFKEQYIEYKKKVRMFGPIWFFITLLILIFLPIGLGIVFL